MSDIKIKFVYNYTPLPSWIDRRQLNVLGYNGVKISKAGAKRKRKDSSQ